MGINGLDWQTVDIPLGIGLDQKGDARSSGPPQLDILKDAQFDEIGGLQTRLPFGPQQSHVLEGTSDIANCRKLTTAGDELLCFTRDSLYSWSPEHEAWVFKATHLAAKVDETPRFVATGDQYGPDRAELNGTIVHAWIDKGRIYAAATDKVSGAVLVAPTDIGSAGNVRVVALQTRILLFSGKAGSGWICRSIDPATPTAGITSIGATIITPIAAGNYFDAVQMPGTDDAAFVNGVVTSYIVGKVNANGTTFTNNTKARTASQITLAVTPDSTRIQIVRHDAIGSVTSIWGDLLDGTSPTFADVITNQIISSVVLPAEIQLTAAYRPTFIPSVGYRCVIFFANNTPTSLTSIASNAIYIARINSDGSGSAGDLFHVGAVGLASKAFAYGPDVYVHIVFAGVSTFGSGGTTTVSQLQNTLYLYREDGVRVGRALVNQASGLVQTGFLPGVASTGVNAFSFVATERRTVPLGTTFDGYADRGPRDVTVTFDSNEARRSVYLGSTLYVTGDEIKQYDGSGLYEVGFAHYPFSFRATADTGGAMTPGTYAYKCTYRWQNAKGETERSTTATIGTITLTSGQSAVNIDYINTLTITNKRSSPVAIELWRTAVNPTEDAPFYLVTSNDPAVVDPAPNSYLTNDPTVGAIEVVGEFVDRMSDAVLTTKETNPENGGFLESLPPPPATVIAASADRIFLGGVPNDPDRIWYSRLRNNGEVASFHDALTFAVPQPGGKITGIAFLNETVTVFRETAVYCFTSDGYANDGTGANYGPSRLLTSDVGAVNAESIALIEQGLLFKSAKGWFVLTKGWGVEYVGAPVSDYDDETPLDARVLVNKHQVRIVTAQRVLCWDYLVNQWADWSINDALSAAVWRGTYQYLCPIGQRIEQTTFDLVNYGMDVETAWIKFPGSIQGDGRIRRILILGEYRSNHVLRVRIARNYEATASEQWVYFDDQYWDPDPAIVGANEQLRIGPSRQQCEAIKIRITLVRRMSVEGGFIYVPPDGEAIKLSGLALEIGTRRGPFRQLPTVQKL